MKGMMIKSDRKKKIEGGSNPKKNNLKIIS
jgi:hypothetical protein